MAAEFPPERADWLTVFQARERILRHALPLDPVAVPLADSPGRVLAREVRAAVDLPPWDNSAMDGYALRGRDLDDFPPDGVLLPVDGEVRAGELLRDPPPPGRAVRIMTGAPVPPGLDTVVRVEDTDRESGTPGSVRITSPRDRGRHIRPRGEDMKAGDLLLEPGTVVTPGRVGLLAAAGSDPVPVHPGPSVVLLPTGDELRRPSDFHDVARGVAIPETNGPTLAAACAAVGALPRLLDPVPDREEALVEALRQAGDAHVLLTLGGASMGTADLVKRALDREGFELDFWRVAMRPGSPFSFGLLPRPGADPLPVFGLPGNPASAFVTFHLLVRPYLLRLAGHTRIHHPVIRALAGEDLPSHPSRTLFLRVRLEGYDAGSPWRPSSPIPDGPDGRRDDPGLPRARRTGPQGSGLVRSLGEAEGLAVIPAGRKDCPPGTLLRVVLLDGEAPGRTDPGYSDRVGP